MTKTLSLSPPELAPIRRVWGVPWPIVPRNGDTERADERFDIATYQDRLVFLPENTVDDTDAGWGEGHANNDRRLLDDRPPHWGSD